MRSRSCERACQTGLRRRPVDRTVDHDREADPVDPRLLADQRADRLADFVVGGFLLAAICEPLFWLATSAFGRCSAR